MNEKLLGKKVSAISLGCDKNRVDLEKMLFKLKNYGFEIIDEVYDADIVIVNTCAFITPAKEEALDNIFNMCALKEKGIIEKVVVSGCLPQRHLTELKKEIPEVDAFVTAKENEIICQIIENIYGIHSEKFKDKQTGRIFTNRGSYAYLKIAEGCNNACSYCTIPRIKGRYTSFPIDDVVDEAKYLAKEGIKELIIVAQDVTRYGEDLGENLLIKLLKKLVDIKGIEWIRIHYAYPEKTSEELLNYMYKEPKICNYLDIPLQHIDDRILKSMRRKTGEKNSRELISKIKENYPTFALRTTFIVGYPSETRKDFKKLCQFLKETKFDYAGFFPYYAEENTPSYFMEEQISERIKKRRLKKIQKIQNIIATEKAKEKVGKVFKVLVDYFDENKGVFVGHNEFLSPTVDFGIEIEDNCNIRIGDFVNVKFIDFDGENFKGVVVYESTK